ncbi:Na+/H+ antiporter NhaA (plasmid) [Pseudomonas iridis]
MCQQPIRRELCAPTAYEYQHQLGFGEFSIARYYNLLINDGLMTFFLLVVSAEIRQEIQNGALANFKSRQPCFGSGKCLPSHRRPRGTK